jgi:ElaA protein
MEFVIQNFEQLSKKDLYDLLHLRSEVFIVEQNCAYQDLDGYDQEALHLLCKQNNTLIAYARMLPPGVLYSSEIYIGRIITAKNYRRQGIGNRLVHEAIQQAIGAYGPHPIKIGAQVHAQSFYERLGFVVCSEPYLDEGTPTVKMLWTPK